MINQNKEITFFHYLKNKPEYFSNIEYDFFKDPSIKCLYGIVKAFYNKFKKNITDDIIENILKNRVIKEFHSKDEIDGSTYFNQALFDTIMSQGHKELDEEHTKFEFEEYAKNQRTWDAVESIIGIMNETVIAGKVDERNSRIRDIIIKGTSLNFDDDLGSNFKDATKHQSIAKKRFSTGYEYFDECLDGGFGVGELVCIAGPAKGGKSLFMANLVRNQVLNGKNVVIITLEMQEYVYLERLGLNVLSLKKEEYRSQIKDTDIFQKKLDVLKQRNSTSLIKPGKLYVKFMPTSQATIPMIENYLNRLEDNLQKKIDLVVLDYINLCSNWKNPNSENTYLKIKTLAEDFRDLLNRKGCAGLTGTQLNREGSTSEKIHEGNIAESHGLIATVDGLFAIKKLSASEIRNNEIGMLHLASRNGARKIDTYRFKVDFDYFRITEKKIQEIIGENTMTIDDVDNTFDDEIKNDDMSIKETFNDEKNNDDIIWGITLVDEIIREKVFDS